MFYCMLRLFWEHGEPAWTNGSILLAFRDEIWDGWLTDSKMSLFYQSTPPDCLVPLM